MIATAFRKPFQSAFAAPDVAPGVQYLLYDAFLTDRAAGAVNGTTSESPFATGGGVTRTVTDGNSKLSIASGVLTFATGGVGVGDPGLWYPSQARAAGTLVIAQVIFAGTAVRIGVGFDDAATGQIRDCVLFTTTTVLQVRVGTIGISVGVYAATTYSAGVIMRGAGMFYFVKGGAFTNWTLLWVSTAGTAAGLPGVVADAGTTTIGTVDNVRSPVASLISACAALAYDTFTRANGALGSTETTDPDGNTISARVWTDQVGTWEIATNVAHASAVSTVAIATYDCGKADTLHTAKAARAAGVVGVVLRYADSSNYIVAYHDGTNAKLDKVIGGSTTSVISAAATYSASADLRVICEGTSFRLFYNNLAVGAVSTISDAAVQSPTLVGIYTTDTNAGNTLNDVTTRARGSGGEYAALDEY